MYTAAKSMLASSKLPVKMAGISLAASLHAREGAVAKGDLGVEDMDPRIKSQVRTTFCRRRWYYRIGLLAIH